MLVASCYPIICLPNCGCHAFLQSAAILGRPPLPSGISCMVNACCDAGCLFLWDKESCFTAMFWHTAPNEISLQKRLRGRDLTPRSTVGMCRAGLHCFRNIFSCQNMCARPLVKTRLSRRRAPAKFAWCDTPPICLRDLYAGPAIAAAAAGENEGHFFHASNWSGHSSISVMFSMAVVCLWGHATPLALTSLLGPGRLRFD